MIRVLVVGSPDWNIPVMVQSVLDDWFIRSCFELTVIHTGNTGAEQFAAEWAGRPSVRLVRAVSVESALQFSDVCLAFSSGGQREVDAIDLCVWAGVPVRVFNQWQGAKKGTQVACNP